MMSKFFRLFVVIALMGVLVGFFTPVAAAAPAAADLPEYFTVSIAVEPALVMVGQRAKFTITVNYGADIPLNTTYNVAIAFSSTPAGWLLNPAVDPSTTLVNGVFNPATLTWTGTIPARTGTETVAGVIAFTVQVGLPTSIGTLPFVINNTVNLSDANATPVFKSATANGELAVHPYGVFLPVITNISH